MLCVSISDNDFDTCTSLLELYDFIEFRLDLMKLKDNELLSLYAKAKSFIATCRPDELSEERSFKLLNSGTLKG